MKTAYVYLILPLLLSASQAKAQDFIREGVYDGGTTKIYVKGVSTDMPGRRNTNYFGLIVSENGGMLAKAYKIEERGGRQAWIPLHQACTEDSNKTCEFTGYLALPPRMAPHYIGSLIMQGGREVLQLNPANSFVADDAKGTPFAPCANMTFTNDHFRGFVRVSDQSGWASVSAMPRTSFRQVNNWSESRPYSHSAQLSLVSSSNASRLGFYVDRPSRLQDQRTGGTLVDLPAGHYSMTPTMAGLGEVRMQLDDANKSSGISVSESMGAIGILLRNQNKNYLLMMDARPGIDSCNMTAMTFVQE